MQNLLAVDLGASSGRVVLANFNGQVLEIKQVHRFENRPLRIFDRMHWNIYSIFEEVKKGIIKAASSQGNIRSIGIDSWAVDYGLLDENGQLLGLPRHYRDPRNLAAMHKVINNLADIELFQRSGIQLMPINTLFQLYAEHLEFPDLLSHTHSLLLIPDLLNYFLTGEIRAEFTNATTTQFYNSLQRNWDVELLTKLGLPVNLLPPIVQPATVLGSIVDRDLLEYSALESLQVVHTTSHDTASAVIAVPSESSSYVYISSGTWSLIGTVVDQPIINDKSRRFNFTNEGGYGNFRFLKNIMGLWLLQETQRNFSVQGISSETIGLIHDAQLAPACRSFFDPDDPRLLQSGDIPGIIRHICLETGQSVPNDSGTLVRSIFESLALKYRYVLDQLEEVTGQHYEVIHIVGGGAQNKLLSQFTANATKRKVISGPVEASAIGNALVQLIALGEISESDQIRKILIDSFQYDTYLPEDEDLWETAFRQFSTLVT